MQQEDELHHSRSEILDTIDALEKMDEESSAPPLTAVRPNVTSRRNAVWDLNHQEDVEQSDEKKISLAENNSDEKEDKSSARPSVVSSRANTLGSASASTPASAVARTDRDLFMQLISKLEPKERDKVMCEYVAGEKVNNLKNMVFGMTLLLLNLDNVNGEPGKCTADQLPMSSGTDEFDACVTYYKPQGILRGTEKEVDQFVRAQIMNSQENAAKFAGRLFKALKELVLQEEANKTGSPSKGTVS
jgi:hypothetical protein